MYFSDVGTRIQILKLNNLKKKYGYGVKKKKKKNPDGRKNIDNCWIIIDISILLKNKKIDIFYVNIDTSLPSLTVARRSSGLWTKDPKRGVISRSPRAYRIKFHKDKKSRFSCKILVGFLSKISLQAKKKKLESINYSFQNFYKIKFTAL